MIRDVTRGGLAGALGTLAMDGLWYTRAVREGSTRAFLAWETADGLDAWEGAPAPAQVGRKVVEAITNRALADGRARFTTNAVHWATGVAWGALGGAVAGRLGRRDVAAGVVTGAVAWSVSYAVLPAIGVYRWPWEYDAKTLGRDLSAHLVYGATTGIAWSRWT